MGRAIELNYFARRYRKKEKSVDKHEYSRYYIWENSKSYMNARLTAAELRYVGMEERKGKRKTITIRRGDGRWVEVYKIKWERTQNGKTRREREEKKERGHVVVGVYICLFHIVLACIYLYLVLGPMFHLVSSQTKGRVYFLIFLLS